MARASVASSSAAGRAAWGAPPSRSSRLPPLEQFQGKERQTVRLADLVDLKDIGMAEPGDGLSLGEEALAVLGLVGVGGPDHLHGHKAVEPSLPGLVDNAHAPRPSGVRRSYPGTWGGITLAGGAAGAAASSPPPVFCSLFSPSSPFPSGEG